VELVSDRIYGLITKRSEVPTVSLGSGPNTYDQLPIFHDMLGLYPRSIPKMAKTHGEAGKVISEE